MSVAVCGSFLLPSPKSSLLGGAGQPVEILSNAVVPENTQFLTGSIASCSSRNHFSGASFGLIPPNNDGGFSSVDDHPSEHRVSRRFSSSHNHHADGHDVGDRAMTGHTSSSVVSVV